MWFPPELLMKREVVYVVDYQFHHWSNSIESSCTPTALLSSGSKNRKFLFNFTFYKWTSFILPCSQLIFMITRFFTLTLKYHLFFRLLQELKLIFKALAAMPGIKWSINGGSFSQFSNMERKFNLHFPFYTVLLLFWLKIGRQMMSHSGLLMGTVHIETRSGTTPCVGTQLSLVAAILPCMVSIGKYLHIGINSV